MEGDGVTEARDQLLRSLMERLRRVEESGERTAVLEESAASEALQLARLIESVSAETGPVDVAAHTALGRLHLLRYQFLPAGERP